LYSPAAKAAGLYNKYGTITLTGCTISGNTTNLNQGSAGGLASSGTATLTGCTISGNSAFRFGGGLSTYGQSSTMTLTGCTIVGNSAGIGGGLMNNGSCTMTLSDCTISGNTTSGGNGGGLYDWGTATLTNCTVSGNAAAAAAGLDTAASGTMTLTDTIVALNVRLSQFGGTPSDLAGIAGSITGSYNLIGSSNGPGFDPLQDGVDGNIVLTSLAGLGLTPLGDYGGPTQTMALLPGSPALGAGTLVSGLTTDQRGQPLDASHPDIGAFQSQGFTLAAPSGGTPQSATVGAAFAAPLTVTVTARNPLEPVAGGLMTFTVNPATGGAAASLSGSSATIGADGKAQVTATANTKPGTYTVDAAAGGGAALFSFDLTNAQIGLKFTGLAAQSITYGTASVTFAGTLSGSGGTKVSQGETVAVTLGGTTKRATIGADGAFSASFDTASLPASDVPYTIGFAYTSDGTFATTSTTSSLAVAKASASVALRSSGSSAVYGQSVVIVATVTAAGGIPDGTVTFFDGATAVGSATLDGAGEVALVTTKLTPGSHAITARYERSSDLLGATSGPAPESVAQDGTQIVLVPHGIFKKKKVVSVALTATVEPLAPGGGMPTGTVTFKVKKKTLGTVAIGGGQATLTVKAASVLKKAITIVYAGDGNFTSSTVTPPALARKSLATLARPMAATRIRGRVHPGGAMRHRER
jgi:hypothetical protein